jgi:histidine triad (HIT) family protein
MDQNSCVFCKVIAKQLPAKIIEETEDLIVISDIAPKAPVHWLIIPKKHIVELGGLKDEDRSLACNMLFVASRLAERLPGNRAFRLVSNNGYDAGQRVFHIHLHFLAGAEMEF